MKTEAERDQEDCIVIISPCCGRVIMAVVNNEHIDAAAQREISAWIIDGFRAEHKTAAEVRNLPFGCRCKQVKRCQPGE